MELQIEPEAAQRSEAKIVFIQKKSFKIWFCFNAVESCIYFVSLVLCSSCANAYSFFSLGFFGKEEKGSVL